MCRGRTVLAVCGFGEQAEPNLTCVLGINMCLSQSLCVGHGFQRLRIRVRYRMSPQARRQGPLSLLLHSSAPFHYPPPIAFRIPFSLLLSAYHVPGSGRSIEDKEQSKMQFLPFKG